MISLDEVRQEVIAAFKAVHEAYYPSILVNYPDFVVVDLENQEDPFISVELDMVRTGQAALGGREILVPGTLMVYFYYREGHGMSGSLIYTDMLNEYLGMTLVGALQFQAVSPMKIRTFPGWVGIMNSIQFDVVSGTC